MKLKSVAVALIMAFGAVSAAQATTYNLGSLPNGDTYLSNATLSGVINVVPGNFLDTFNFSLSGLPSLDASAGALNFGVKKVINLNSFSYSLYDAGNTLLGSSTNNLGFTLSGLADGNYYLNVSGIATGTAGGKYDGVLSAVPEPETYAMFLAGLGLMGFIARRRSKQ